MSERRTALGRAWALLWIGVIGYLLGAIILTVAVIWGIIDLVWSFITGRDDLSAESRPARLVSDTLEWVVGQTVYGLTGGGDRGWRMLPTS